MQLSITQRIINEAAPLMGLNPKELRKKINELPESELEELYRELSTVSEQVEENALLFFSPLPYQKPFFLSGKKINIAFGGNRSGKTTCNIAKAMMHATLLYPDWFPEELRFTHPTKGRIIGTDFRKHIATTIAPEIKRWVPPSMIKRVRRNPQGVVDSYELTNGSTFDIMSNEQENQLFENWKGHWVAIDEPVDETKWIPTLRGLVDYAGVINMSLTPLEGAAWMYDYFVQNPPEQIKENTAYWWWNIWDNSASRGGYLDDREIEIFLDSCSPEERDARETGKFLMLSGAIYKKFGEAHIVDDFEIPEYYTRYMICDPHPVKDYAFLWGAVSPRGEIYWYDEELCNLTIPEMAKMIKAKEGNTHIRLRYMDPNMGRTRTISGRVTLVEEFAKHRIYFNTDFTNDINVGHKKVAELLDYDPQVEGSYPRMFFLRNGVPQTIRSMRAYCWGKANKPEEKYKDFPDCVRYGVVAGMRFVERFDPNKLPRRAQRAYI